jgi:hypothetical protein
MEQNAGSVTIERLCAFLPPDVRRRVLGLLLEAHGDEKWLAKEIGCSLSSLREWAKGNGHTPGDKYMPTILSLALASCPEAGNLLGYELLEEVESLCADLDISQEVGKGELGVLMDTLDEKSREILWHFWWYGHASIDELRDLIESSTDMEVLFRLREVINPTAERILGEPILEFYESRVDPSSGEKILFNWWYGFDTTGLEEGGFSWGGRRGGHLVDLFDEERHIVVIAQLPSSVRVVEEADVAYRNGILRIKLEKF